MNIGHINESLGNGVLHVAISAAVLEGVFVVPWALARLHVTKIARKPLGHISSHTAGQTSSVPDTRALHQIVPQRAPVSAHAGGLSAGATARETKRGPPARAMTTSDSAGACAMIRHVVGMRHSTESSECSVRIAARAARRDCEARALYVCSTKRVRVSGIAS